ncbi:MAG: thiamine diphosphokinase [Mesorhizobium sp.]|nr:thiamine diphosphokinase [Mesorhizobium sp.]
MSLFLILLGGDLTATPRLAAQAAGARVIAADSGIRHAGLLGIAPELWVGDFDSATDADYAAFPDVERRTFSAAKDKTDGELAIDIALERGATRLLIAGAFGGPRADHAFLHLALAMRLAERGIDVRLTSGAQEGLPLLAGEAAFDYAPGTLFSILGFTELSGLSVSGAEWPLHQVTVPFGSSLTISNRVTASLRIGLQTGRALLLAHPTDTRA